MCILGPSEGVVLERLQAFLNANWDRRGVWGEHKIESWAASAIKLGLHVPAALSEKVAENDEKSRLGKIERARNSLQEARNRLVMAERDLNAAEQFAIS